MKKHLAMMVAGLLCACCLGLAACGGTSSSSAASGSASASAASGSASASASAPASASATSGSTSASAAVSSASASASAASASSAASADVSPELQEAAETMVALADKEVALVEKAKGEGGFAAVESEWNELSKQITDATNALKPYSEKYADGSLSDADKAYYMKVVVPAASKSASAGLEMLDLIEI